MNMSFNDWKKIFIDTWKDLQGNFWLSNLLFLGMGIVYFLTFKYQYIFYIILFFILLNLWLYFLEFKRDKKKKLKNKKNRKNKRKLKLNYFLESFKWIKKVFFDYKSGKIQWVFINFFSFLFIFYLYFIDISGLILAWNEMSYWKIVFFGIIMLLLSIYFIYLFGIIFQYYWIMDKRKKKKGIINLTKDVLKESFLIFKEYNRLIEKKWMFIILFNTFIFVLFYNEILLKYLNDYIYLFVFWNLFIVNLFFEINFFTFIYRKWEKDKENENRERSKYFC